MTSQNHSNEQTFHDKEIILNTIYSNAEIQNILNKNTYMIWYVWC